MERIHFIVFSSDHAFHQTLVEYFKRNNKRTIICPTEKRFFKPMWSGMDELYALLQDAGNTVVPIDREDVYGDIQAEIAIALWQLIKKQTDSSVWVIIPVEIATILPKEFFHFFERPLNWDTLREEPRKEGDLWYFDLTNPIERPFSLEPISLHTVVRKNKEGVLTN